MLKLYEKINCAFSASEKEACLPLVRRLIGINNESRKNGFLSIEDDITNMNEEKDFFLKTALQLVLDAPANYTLITWQKDPIKKSVEAIENILSNLVISDGTTGAELLGRLLIIQGVKAMTNGENSILLCHQLLSMLGTDYLKKAEDYVKSEYVKA